MWRKLQTQRQATVAATRKLQWHAVEVLASKAGCPAVQALKGTRFLSVEAPLLPLSECTRSGTCSCMYRKYPDRRVEARREQDDTALRRAAVPTRDRRIKRGRRKSD